MTRNVSFLAASLRKLNSLICAIKITQKLKTVKNAWHTIPISLITIRRNRNKSNYLDYISNGRRVRLMVEMLILWVELWIVELEPELEMEMRDRERQKSKRGENRQTHV